MNAHHDGQHQYVICAFPQHNGAYLVARCSLSPLCPENDWDDEATLEDINTWVEAEKVFVTVPQIPTSRTCETCGYTDHPTLSGIGALGPHGEWRYWVSDIRCWKCRNA
jgi:hypothetical protein